MLCRGDYPQGAWQRCRVIHPVSRPGRGHEVEGRLYSGAKDALFSLAHIHEVEMTSAGHLDPHVGGSVVVEALRGDIGREWITSIFHRLYIVDG